MKSLKTALTTGALLAIAAGTGNASTLTYWYNIFGPTPDPTTPMTAAQATLVSAPSTSSLQIAKFNETIPGDPAHKNVLTDVGLFVDWAATGTVGVGNVTGTFFDLRFPAPPSTTHSFVNATSSVVLTLTGSPAFPTTLNIPTQGVVPSGTVPGGQAASYASSGTGSSENHVGINNLGLYEGNGPANMTFLTSTSSATFGGTETDGSGDLFFGGTAQTGGILQVVYTFDTVASGVPEPATMTTLGSALIALSLIARKFSNKRS